MESCKKFGVKRWSKTIKKPEETGRRSKVNSFPEKMKINFPVFSAAASTAGASTGASFTHESLGVKVDDNGALTIFLRSSSDMDGASDPYFISVCKAKRFIPSSYSCY